ncbi:uncharacterized protein LOC132618798 [Lycium barbarum]|uniref:uncharacterized protein LOC132618798 n=1 Tax=Lycium barbarum TaxID=112863 RepID=UPI00293F67C2|nr:uncharacterized protein LOC132618798 [Lycium barbarum]
MDRMWMYNMNNSNRVGVHDEFVEGVDGFIKHAMTLYPFQNEGVIRCPCSHCRCMKYLKPEAVRVHLYSRGFKQKYYVWTDHGETDGVNGIFYNMVVGESSVSQEYSHVQYDRVNDMVNDAFGVQSGFEPEQNFEEPPNEEAMRFYQELEEASHPLWVGSQHSKLSIAVRMINIKSDWTVAEAAMDSMIKLVGELVSPEFDIPKSYYEAKRLVSKLGLSYDRIHYCPNGCMLFYKQDVDLNECKICGHARYKRTPSGKTVPIKAMHYLPIIPRLKRLFASPSSAPHMRWHSENRRPPGVMCHPSDGEAWKHFDRTYPDFASESRNIRLGLCADGFTPYSVSAAPYSCWPVFLTPYNLPPEMCMTSPYIFLNCVIPGPRNPKVLIDVYLQPLIDELKQLWCEGVVTYDISTKAYWQTPEFIAKSEQAKAARASQKGGSLHTAGARSQGHVARTMKKATGQMPTQDQLFLKTHTKKKKHESDPTLWVEDRAHDSYRQYMDHVDQYSQTQPEHPSRPPPELEIDFWCRTVGGVQKGRAYGLGPRNNLSRLRSGLRGEGSSRQAEGVDDVQVAAMAQQIAELNRKLAELRQEELRKVTP